MNAWITLSRSFCGVRLLPWLFVLGENKLPLTTEEICFSKLKRSVKKNTKTLYSGVSIRSQRPKVVQI